MDTFGYHTVEKTLGLWVHDHQKNIFSLAVNGFCVFYSSVEDADHFFNALKAKYLITVDMEAKVYIGIKLYWDYVNITVILSMPNYMPKALHIFQHIFMGGK